MLKIQFNQDNPIPLSFALADAAEKLTENDELHLHSKNQIEEEHIIELGQSIGLTYIRTLPPVSEASIANHQLKTLEIVFKKARKDHSIREEKLMIFYDGISPFYSEFTKKCSYKVPKWLQGRLATNSLPSKAKILDLGCADGSAEEWMNSANNRFELFGIDISHSMIAKCRTKPSYSSCFQYDLDKGLPMKERHFFDAVLLLGTFEFIEHKDALLSQVYDALNLGGRIFLTMEASEEDTDRVYSEKNGVKKHLASRKTIKSILLDSGFTIDIIENIDTAYTSPTYGKKVNYFAIEAHRANE